MTCSIEGCTRRARCRSWCGTHYERWRRHGDPSIAHVKHAPALERFADKVEIADCWIWTGFCNSDGYGSFWDGRRQVRAHRWAYEYLTGTDLGSLPLDHLCRNRGCVNPDHLEPVTQRENTARGVNQVAAYMAATACTRGHAYTPGNTYTPPNGRGRHCRTCRRLRDRAWDHKRRNGCIPADVREALGLWEIPEAVVA